MFLIILGIKRLSSFSGFSRNVGVTFCVLIYDDDDYIFVILFFFLKCQDNNTEYFYLLSLLLAYAEGTLIVNSF